MKQLIIGVLMGSIAYLVLNEVFEVQNPLEWAVPVGAWFAWAWPRPWAEEEES